MNGGPRSASPVIPVVLAIGLALAPPARAALDLPDNFVRDDVVPGVTFDTPTAIAFTPGRMLVAEKRGRVYSVQNGVRHATPLWNRENEVLNEHDRGLLGLAVDPNYATNRYIYLLYTVDPDSNGTDNNGDGFGRLTRYQVSAADSNALVAGSRTILMGVDWRNGPCSGSPSHTIGSLRFGSDGSLLVSTGDGAQYTQVDEGGLDAALFGNGKTDPFEDIGAFRSQYIGSLAGKVLRINPANGQGYLSNPYDDGNLSSVRSRVWAYGLRNPFRFCVRPGTGSGDPTAGQPGVLFLGDVGWNTWEEMNVATTGGRNFGWPCDEGLTVHSGYQSADPAHHDCGTMGTSENPATHTPPLATWHHSWPDIGSPPGFIGNASVGGVFYTGTAYPAEYRQQYFFSDYGKDWIKVGVIDGANQLVEVLDFATDVDGAVDLATHPVTGDLYYPAILTGKIHRIRYTGAVGNQPPTANASGAPMSGVAPLTVNFSSAGSSDPDLDPITTAWVFGDATGSSAANPSHTYPSPGTYLAILTVTDDQSAQASDTVVVQVLASGAFPTTGVLDNFNRANGPIGGAWVDEWQGLVIDNAALEQTGGASSTVWSAGTFGPDQEAYITLNAITPTAPEHDLMLKVQGLSWSSGHIEVRYDAPLQHVTIATYDPATTWVLHGTIPSVVLAPGDRFGARALANGTVTVYRNGASIGSASVASWSHYDEGGRLGLTIGGATASRLDDFGGGTMGVGAPNTAPQAIVVAPLANAFFAEGDTIRLDGDGSDAQDPPGSLAYHWQMNIHHNNHVHPSSFVSDLVDDSFIGENHDDGTGVFLEVQLQVTDTGGLKDTTAVNLYPEIDLAPTLLPTLPSTPGTTAPATYRFRVHNTGRMPAPFSHWRLRADGATLAEGDTLVPALDSVLVTRTLPPTLAGGFHVLRVAVDTLHTVVETDEADNGVARTIEVVVGPGPDEVAPQFTTGPIEEISESAATLRWSTDELASGSLAYGLTPAANGTVVAVPQFALDQIVQITGLVPQTKYFYRVSAIDGASNLTAAAVDSFTTPAGVTGVGDVAGPLALSGGQPNPSSGAVGLALTLPRAAHVRFAIYDLLGRAVWEARPQDYGAGHWVLRWDGASPHGARAAPGVYLARVTVDGKNLTRRIAILR